MNSLSAQRALLCCAALALTTACTTAPDLYAPPMDRKPMSVAGRAPIGPFVNMNDPNADAYLVRDIGKRVESGTWRWTRQNPEMRFFLDSANGWKFKMDFAIASSTFQQTGPVTLAYFVNNQPFDSVTYNQPGSAQFEKAVLPAMLIARSFNTVSIRQ
ncbi:MAG: hypothetical protein M3Z85_21840, partial [Acidobacteriota bacterium]|nr:hypothetical protein [Acidobacteriota bacterium]